MSTCYQINLQSGFGGGEVYTGFFSRVLMDLGWQSVLVVRRGSVLSQTASAMASRVVEVDGPEDVLKALPEEPAVVVAHTFLPPDTAEAVRRRHALVYFAHMPLYGRNPEPFRHCDVVFAVSQHVIVSLRAAGIAHCYPHPLYGVADLERPAATDGRPIFAQSVYDWDRRKGRDRLLGLIHPLVQRLKPARRFAKRPGLTLGIVSRITPIKQFPLMFEILAPVIARFPEINLEIFGSGGYASMRDFRRSLRPIARQVRFWGHQANVREIYPQLDFLLTGLPEKEALGLNVIEAQACGTPVLAVAAPPFTETVVDGETGFLFADPRHDGGEDFGRLLARISRGGERPDLRLAAGHLEKFSFSRFAQRVAAALDHVSKNHAHRETLARP